MLATLSFYFACNWLKNPVTNDSAWLKIMITKLVDKDAMINDIALTFIFVSVKIAI